MDQWNYPQKPSVFAALGPLPEVEESSRESTWDLFQQLQAERVQPLDHTQPLVRSTAGQAAAVRGAPLEIQDVMAEARRRNRVAPQLPHWHRLCAMLAEATGETPPAAMEARELAAAPPLARRIRVRDQVEWAAARGLLPQVLFFFRSLAEQDWVHLEDSAVPRG